MVIEERPVPKGDVPGEWYSPTQPFPTKPPAYARQGVSMNDLVDFTPELRAQAEKVVSQYKMGPMYTPPVESKAGGPLATLTLPSPAGGTNWPGAAYDPETHMVYAYAQDTITPLGPVRLLPNATDMDFVMERIRRVSSISSARGASRAGADLTPPPARTSAGPAAGLARAGGPARGPGAPARVCWGSHSAR